MNIPADKDYPDDAVQCTSCGGTGTDCRVCANKGWLPKGHPLGRHCLYWRCNKPLHPTYAAVYCSNECAFADGEPDTSNAAMLEAARLARRARRRELVKSVVHSVLNVLIAILTIAALYINYTTATWLEIWMYLIGVWLTIAYLWGRPENRVEPWTTLFIAVMWPATIPIGFVVHYSEELLNWIARKWRQ